jgi:hypothetical protein
MQINFWLPFLLSPFLLIRVCALHQLLDTSKFGKVKRITFAVSKINYCQGISAIKQTAKMLLQSRATLSVQASRRQKGYVGICLMGSNGINVAYSSDESSVLSLSLQSSYLMNMQLSCIQNILSALKRKCWRQKKKIILPVI